MNRLEAMSIVLAVAEAGSLSAAARQQKTPLATVSRKVSELEAHLQTKLFNRSSRALVPTDAGRSYIAAAKRILGLLLVLNIGRRAVPSDDVRRLIAQRIGAQQEPAVFAIEPPKPSLCFTSRARLPYLVPHLWQVFQIVWMNRISPSLHRRVQ